GGFDQLLVQVLIAQHLLHGRIVAEYRCVDETGGHTHHTDAVRGQFKRTTLAHHHHRGFGGVVVEAARSGLEAVDGSGVHKGAFGTELHHLLRGVVHTVVHTVLVHLDHLVVGGRIHFQERFHQADACVVEDAVQ